MFEAYLGAAAAKPIIKFASKILEPLTRAVSEGIEERAAVATHALMGGYAQYASQAYERHSFFNSIVFKNEQRKLLDYYLPLTLVNTRTEKELLIDGFPAEELSLVRRMLVVDSAGMGKTTLLKYLFLSCIDAEAGIPIFVELRRLGKKANIVEFLLAQLGELDKRADATVFLRLIRAGNFIFFFDGYDEVAEGDRMSVNASIQELIEKAPSNRFIISSREEEELVSFSSFQRYTIRPLQIEEAFNLIRKYGASTIAEVLIERLSEPANRSIHEFLVNPLLTSLLFKSFEYKPTLPLQRHLFYRQVYEALFESHDLTKEGGYVREKRTGLPVDRFERVVRGLGAVTYQKQKVEYTNDEAHTFAKSALELVSEAKKVQASDLLYDLTHAVPLLTQDGMFLRWSHRSIQEYFAAQYLCKATGGRLNQILVKYFKDDTYVQHLNLLSLCADIDPGSFDNSFGREVATYLLQEYEGYVFDPQIPERLAAARASVMTGRKLFLVSLSKRQKDFPDIPAANAALGEESRGYLQEMSKIAGITGPGMLRHGYPGLGELHPNIHQLLSAAANGWHWPFVVKREARQTPREINAFEKLPLTSLDCGKDNALNALEHFGEVTEYLECHFSWVFDATAARKFLHDLDERAERKAAEEPW